MQWLRWICGCARALAIVWCLSEMVSQGQISTPQPLLLTVSPVALQKGVATEVTISGADLDGASKLHFSVPGVDCKPALDAKQKPLANKFTVTIPMGAPSGPCDVRVVARYGISNPRGVQLTALPVVALPASAVSSETAVKAPVDCVIAGTTLKQASGFVSFEAKKGQRLLAVCRPGWLDSRVDAALTLQNTSGKVLERLQPDGVLDFTPPADGTYLLKVSDLMFRGDSECPFALTLTTGPVVEYVFAGDAAWILYGRNLPKGADAVKHFGKNLQRLQAPPEEAKKLLASNPVKALCFESETAAPGSDVSKAVALKVPTTYTSWFPDRGKPRYFTFEAHKGEVFWIEINCASRGVRADPFLIVESMGKDGPAFIAEANDRPALVAKDEFDAGWADPTYRFEAKGDGVYRIKLRNLYSNSPPEPFELTVKPVGSDFNLVAIPSALPKAKTVVTVDINAAPLWRGGVATMKVCALRRSGFTGAIELSAEGLPDGVKFCGGLVREGQSIGYATFAADEGAKEWAGPIQLHGKTGGNAMGASVVFKVVSTAKEPVVTRFTDEVVLGVVQSDAPVLVEASGNSFDATEGGKVSIPLQVKRRADCTEAFKLSALGLNDAAVDVDIAAKATSAKLDLDLAKLKLPVGDYQIVLQGSVKFKHKRMDDPKAAAKDVTFLADSKPVRFHIKPVEKK